MNQPVPLFGKEYKRDPYPLYARLREQGAVHPVRFPSGVIAWLIVGYDAARERLTDPRMVKNHDHGNEKWRSLASIMPEPQHSQLQAHLLHQDPPKHTVMRKHMIEPFGPRRTAALRPRFEEIAHELLDPMVKEGRGDLVAGFAAQFPFRVLSEVIGLPDEFQRRFRREWCKVVAPVGPKDPRRSYYIGLLEGLQGYIDEVIGHKRARPEDDLLSSLVQAGDEGELSHAEVASIIFQLLVAGQEPVTNQITTGVLALLDHPGELARLRDDPGLMPSAVEELYRYDGAFELTTWRFFTEPTEVAGALIPAGDSVIISLAAANRDPEQFTDPDTLDLSRSPNPHLGFGHGIHFCAGASLGRLELQIAFAAIVERLPELRLSVPAEELDWIPAVLGRGVNALPVTFAT
jgi:cytochrome P450